MGVGFKHVIRYGRIVLEKYFRVVWSRWLAIFLKPGPNGVFFWAILQCLLLWGETLPLASTFLLQCRYVERTSEWSVRRHLILSKVRLVERVIAAASLCCCGRSKTCYEATILWLHTVAWACSDTGLMETSLLRVRKAARGRHLPAIPGSVVVYEREFSAQRRFACKKRPR